MKKYVAFYVLDFQYRSNYITFFHDSDMVNKQTIIVISLSKNGKSFSLLLLHVVISLSY